MKKPKTWCDFDERAAALTERRNLKMARSPHAFVRGATQKFYEWLDGASGLKLPQGPAVWICGDCHSGNLGPLANTKGRIDIQIRDLDQTVVGNPVHDVIRLGLSMASAARGSDLPGVMTARMMEDLVDGYQAAFGDAGTRLDRPEAVKAALTSAVNRRWKHLAEERLGDARPQLKLGNHFWPITDDERESLNALFADEKVRRMVTALRGREDDAGLSILDAAYWVKGCSSLGRVRYAALVAIENGGQMCLIDIKEATKALAPRYPDADMPRDNAERVVAGAWHLSPALGDRMVAGRLLDRSVFLRELLPQDLKLDLERLSEAEAGSLARYLGNVVGIAHARQMDADARRDWHRDLARGRSKTLDAPSWLWSSVVELMASHESAYLEHCRRYALRAEAEAA
ncbi:DUF2252 family protein [Asticcacaulis solisilvae]|uniref:DUF2252 family protein n=1 Tax=Asticcacaulis solisilvae TaxID=1217274 RepID=UPI003FD727FD